MSTSSKNYNAMRAIRAGRPVKTFIILLFLFLGTILLNLPKIDVNWKIGKYQIKSIGGYNIDLPNWKKDLSLRKGLDLQGGVQLTLQADMKEIKNEDKEDALNSVRDVIDRRVNLYGVSEPVVQSAKAGEDYRVIVELPGVTNVNEALDLVGKTAKLEFREPIDASESAAVLAQYRPLFKDASSSASASESAQLNSQIDQYILNQFGYKPTALTGKELQKATVSFNQQNGEPQVELVFKPEGAKMFADLTTKHIYKQIAIYLDEDQISAPTVNSQITDGRAIISGGFTIQDAQKLATQLNAGALPVPIKVIEQRTIGATLGEQSVNKSIVAGAVGIAIVGLFMISLYGLNGLLAVFALILYSLISLVIFRFIPVTLTLAGIAGFILSIGMATDANILIFERMREEMRWGRSKRDALKLGFDRAWSSIRDSNVSSLITCFILYSFGTGLIRGFALTLAIGIVVSMFTAITVTRTFLRMIYK